MSRLPAIPCGNCGRKFGGAETLRRHRRVAGDRFVCASDPDLLSQGFYRDKWGVWHRGSMNGQMSLLGTTENDREAIPTPPAVVDPVTVRDLPTLREDSIARTKEAIERVDRNAEDEWKVAADAAIATLCEIRDTLTADDVWWLLEDSGIEPPREPRALGARMQAAARRGQIVNTRRTVKSRRPVTHGSWVAEWAVVRPEMR